MNRSQLNFLVGGVLLLIFAMMLFAFQVRRTETALVTTFGKPVDSGPITKSGLYWKLPWPIQKVQKFDNRIQNFEGRFEETLTQDGKNLMVLVYAGWKISNPETFRKSFNDSVADAEKRLEDLVRSEKGAVVGTHPFSDFISPDEKKLKFVEIETEMLERIRKPAADKYGIDVVFLHIKRLGLPESITEKVFERMKAERQKFVDKLKAEGDGRAIDIRSEADSERIKTLAQAEAKVIELRGSAEAEAAKYYEIMEKNPELAIFLQKLTTLEQTLKERSTLILDERTPPFDLLKGGARPMDKK